MFKILVADDEKRHRSGLLRLLYTIYPQDMLLEADSGEQALEIMRLLECEIVITDIRMAGMDGLELLRRIRQEFADAAVVILSGYGEFDYARDALKYGASDYLLKPVDMGEVKKCLDKVRGEILERRSRSQDEASMKSQLKETEAVYMEYLMRQFLENPDFEKKERLREIFPLEQPGWFFLCRARREDGQGETTLDVWELRMAVKQYIRQGSSFSFASGEKDVCGVLVLSREKGDRSWFEGLGRTLERSLPGWRFSFAVSGVCQNMFREGPRACREARTVLQYGFYEPGDWSDYDLEKDRLGGEPENPGDLGLRMAEQLRQNDILGAFTAVRGYVEAAAGERLAEPDKLLRQVMLLLFQTVKALDTMLSDEEKGRTDEALMKIYHSAGKSQLLRAVYGYLLEIGKDVNFRRETKGLDVLEHCREYLDSHYMEELTLDTVAEKYYFNPSYFSTLFKNYFGKSFSGYLTELRMSRARKLLVDGEAGRNKIKEIAAKVGYRDANYFIRAFKKFYGYTPEEYRKLKAQD